MINTNLTFYSLPLIFGTLIDIIMKSQYTEYIVMRAFDEVADGKPLLTHKYLRSISKSFGFGTHGSRRAADIRPFFKTDLIVDVRQFSPDSYSILYFTLGSSHHTLLGISCHSSRSHRAKGGHTELEVWNIMALRSNVAAQ
jgi:hypothetical protein